MRQVYSELNFKGKSIPIREKNFSSSKKCHTSRYYEALKIIENENIAQLEISNTLDFYFNKDETVPDSEKFSIEEINYCPHSRIILFRMGRMGNLDCTYENRIEFARATGWYFYVTGIDIPQSEISKYVDGCSHRFNKEQLKWDFNTNVNLAISPITCFPNENSYLLQIGNRNILLDAGLPKDPIQLKNSIQSIKEKGNLDAIFISHAHNDHIRGLSDIIKEFPNVPIILSATSLDLLLLEQQHHYKNIDEIIINNSIVVKNKEKIYLNRNGYLQFFFAGHMPGALMLFLEFDKCRFLFTGDYSFHSYRPIPGIDLAINDIPSPIDFLLVDGTSSYIHYDTPPYQFNFLRDQITFKAQHKNNVLIGADYSSIAIIIFLTLHNHFLSLKENAGFELRPNFFLSDNIRESVQILCSRLDDIHPATADNIENELNPFAGALIRWIRNRDDKFDLEKILRERSQYLFSWDEIPRNHNGRLIEFLTQNFGIDWIKTAKIEKIDSDKTIRVSTEEKSLFLRLNDGKTKLNIEIDDGRTDELITKTENGRLNIYRTWKKGNVVIFHSPDLTNKWMVDFFKIIALDKFNSIYLAGALRSLTANELVSGRDDVEFQSRDKIEKFVNKATILNRIKPDNILNLHGDDYQLGKIIEILKPKQICFFQQDPKKLKGVRNWIVEEYPFVEKTHAFYPKANNKILIQGL